MDPTSSWKHNYLSFQDKLIRRWMTECYSVEWEFIQENNPDEDVYLHTGRALDWALNGFTPDDPDWDSKLEELLSYIIGECFEMAKPDEKWQKFVRSIIGVADAESAP